MFEVTPENIEGRLRLLRYGLIVVTITAFLVSFLTHWGVMTRVPEFAAEGIGASITWSLIVGVVVAVISVAVYFGYSFFLNSRNSTSSTNDTSESAA